MGQSEVVRGWCVLAGKNGEGLELERGSPGPRSQCHCYHGNSYLYREPGKEWRREPGPLNLGT